jgi:hypothetical protein
MTGRLQIMPIAEKTILALLFAGAALALAAAPLHSREPANPRAVLEGSAPAVETASAPGEGEAQQALYYQSVADVAGKTGLGPEERGKFVDGVMNEVWEEFVSVHCRLLLSEEEYAELGGILDRAGPARSFEGDLEARRYLDSKFSDTLDILAEMALMKKDDILQDRFEQMEESCAKSSAALGKIKDAKVESAMGRYFNSVRILNGLSCQ